MIDILPTFIPRTCFVHHHTLHNGKKTLRNEKLLKPNKRSVTQELFYQRSPGIWGCSVFFVSSVKYPRTENCCHWVSHWAASVSLIVCLMSPVFLPLNWGYFFLSNFLGVKLTVPFPLQMLHFQEAHLLLSHFFERTEKMVNPYSCFSIHIAWRVAAWRLKWQLGSTSQDFQRLRAQPPAPKKDKMAWLRPWCQTIALTTSPSQ